MFIKRTEECTILMGLYVDDLFGLPIVNRVESSSHGTGKTDRLDPSHSLKVWSDFIANLKERFATVEDRGPISFALGTEITQNSAGVSMTLKTFISKLRILYNLSDPIPRDKGTMPSREPTDTRIVDVDVSPHPKGSAGEESRVHIDARKASGSRSPASPGLDLTGCAAPEAGSLDHMWLQGKPIRNASGSLQFAACVCRPDVAHIAGILARRVGSPSVEHWYAHLRALKYLTHTSNRGLFYHKNKFSPNGTLFAAVDSDWAGDQYDRKSTAGGVIYFMGSPIDWFSRKEAVVALSSCEAEYIALCLLIRSVIHLRILLGELGYTQLEPTTVVIDSKSAHDLAKDAKFRKRSKHIDIQYHYVRECIEKGYIKLHWLKGTSNPADIFTKSVLIKTFEFHLQNIMWDMD